MATMLSRIQSPEVRGRSRAGYLLPEPKWNNNLGDQAFTFSAPIFLYQSKTGVNRGGEVAI